MNELKFHAYLQIIGQNMLAAGFINDMDRKAVDRGHATRPVVDQDDVEDLITNARYDYFMLRETGTLPFISRIKHRFINRTLRKTYAKMHTLGFVDEPFDLRFDIRPNR